MSLKSVKAKTGRKSLPPTTGGIKRPYRYRPDKYARSFTVTNIDTYVTIGTVALREIRRY
jgi:hypothetical protein